MVSNQFIFDKKFIRIALCVLVYGFAKRSAARLVYVGKLKRQCAVDDVIMVFVQMFSYDLFEYGQGGPFVF